MAAFTKTSDGSGKEVVRCFVKGAALAVMSHAASALCARRSIPWDADLGARAEANVTRMEEQGLRVMAGAFRDLEELIMAIGTYIDRHNESPKPFIWTARASDILEKVKRARRTLNTRRSV